HDAEWLETALAVDADRFVEGVDAHAVLVVNRKAADVVHADAENGRGFVDAPVRLDRGVEHEGGVSCLQALLAKARAPGVQGRTESVKGGDRTAWGEYPARIVAIAEQPAQPVKDGTLDHARGRPAAPDDA